MEIREEVWSFARSINAVKGRKRGALCRIYGMSASQYIVASYRVEMNEIERAGAVLAVL